MLATGTGTGAGTVPSTKCTKSHASRGASGFSLARPATCALNVIKRLRGGAGQRVGYTKIGPRASPNRNTQNHYGFKAVAYCKAWTAPVAVAGTARQGEDRRPKCEEIGKSASRQTLSRRGAPRGALRRGAGARRCVPPLPSRQCTSCRPPHLRAGRRRGPECQMSRRFTRPTRQASAMPGRQAVRRAPLRHIEWSRYRAPAGLATLSLSQGTG